MKWFRIALPSLLTCITLPVLAENPQINLRAAPTTGMFSLGELKPTPEMWFYEQYLRQSQDPKVAVRANAEFRAEQRQRRIAALKWFGFSNQRPRAGVDFIHSDNSPSWTSNHMNYPSRWGGTGAAPVVVRSEQ